MGRVLRSTGAGSGRAGENSRKTGQRTKRKKRKQDLDELRRNALEAKRNLRQRGPHNIKWKNAFAKVLNNFADKRQENENTTHGNKNKKGTKAKPRTICSRLLPQPTMGIYKNGAKGREIRKANRPVNETNEARRQGDILKLLEGDETSPERKTENESRLERQQPAAFSSDESDHESESVGVVKDDPILDKVIKGIKWINREEERNAADRKNEATHAKDKPKNLRVHKETKCKRRLFEPSEDGDKPDENSFGIIDYNDEIMDEICFSPKRVNDVDSGTSKSCVTKYANSLEKQIGLESQMHAGGSVWPAKVCYKILCDKICADNFDNLIDKCTDPVNVIRKLLTNIYRKRNPKMVNPDYCIPTSKLSSESKARITNSELDQDTSNSCATTKVGSWHQHDFGDCSSQGNTNIQQASNIRITSDESKFHNNSNAGKNSLDKVENTINSVTRFLKKLKENNPLIVKEKMFSDDIDAAQSSGQNQSINNYPAKPSRDFTFDLNLQRLVNKNTTTKHIPAILRRANGRSSVTEKVEENILSRAPFRGHNHQKVDLENPLKPETQSPSAESDTTDSIQTPSCVTDHARMKVLKSKLNFMRAKYKSRSRIFENGEDKNTGRYPIIVDSLQMDNNNNNNGRKHLPRVIYQNKGREAHGGGGRKVTFHTTNDYDIQDESVNLSGNEQPFQTYQPFVRPNLKQNCLPRVYHENHETLPERNLRFAPVNVPQHNNESPGILHDNTKNCVPSRMSRFASFCPSLSKQGNDVRTENNQRINHSQSFQSLLSFNRDEHRTFDGARNETTRCIPPIQHRIRKPVMLFRPIDESRHKRETRDPRCHQSHRNRDATMCDTATKFRGQLLEGNVDHRRAGPGKLYDYLNEQQDQQQQQQQQLSQPYYQLQETVQNQGKMFDTRPIKYLAVDQANGGMPAKIPIYVNKNPGITYAMRMQNRVNQQRFDEIRSFAPSADDDECIIAPQQQYRVSQVNHAKPKVPRHCYQQQSNDFPLNSEVPVPTVSQYVPMCNNVPTIFNNMPSCVSESRNTFLGDATTRGQARFPNNIDFNQESHQTSNLPKRVQLTDGRIGIWVPESCTIVDSERFHRSSIANPATANVNDRRTLNHGRMNEANFNEAERNHSNFVLNETIYSQPATTYHQWDTIYNVPNGYPSQMNQFCESVLPG